MARFFVVVAALLAVSTALPTSLPGTQPVSAPDGVTPVKAKAASPKGLFAKAQAFFAAFHKHQKKASADPNYKGPNGMFQGMGPGGMIMQYEHMHTWFCGQEGNKVKAVCNKEKKAAKGPHPLFAKNHAAHNDWMEMANGWCGIETNKSKFVCKALLHRLNAGALLNLPSLAHGR